MKHYAGLDVSVKETSVCIIDEAGKTTREVKVASEPEARAVSAYFESEKLKRFSQAGKSASVCSDGNDGGMRWRRDTR